MGPVHLTVALLWTAIAVGGHGGESRMLEWPYVGAEQGHTKYSPASDISTANVGELAIAWRWEPNESPMEEYGTRPGAFQATPIMVDNVLYLSTMYTRVVALDAGTGAELWTSDPKAYGADPGVPGQAASSIGASPTGKTATTRAFSSTAATACTR